MKSRFPLTTLFAVAIFVLPLPVFGQFKELREKAAGLLGGDPWRVEKLISKFEKGQPVSTTFDDAIYEADFLGNFEPSESEYRPLDIQPKAIKVGYLLKSGLYTMNAKSFCLRGYTYGPSKGDGHLYAPLKGKKADFVQSIIEHFAANPEIPQQDVQVLIWAVIAGADMNTLGEQHAKTLNSLFTTKELLNLTTKGWVDEYVDSQIGEWKKSLLGKIPAKLQELLDADEKIRSMVKGNKSFQEIERVAVIAGVAPRDMIREVSKGRWSYHPDGYFVRFFPNGYSETRLDVFVPYKDAVQTDARGKAIGLDSDAIESQEVVFNPSGMVASPANRPSQRIGISPVPVNPTKDKYDIIFYSFNRGKPVPISKCDMTLDASTAGHMYIGFAKNGAFEKVKGFSPREHGRPIDAGAKVDNNTDESYLLGYHTRCFALNVTKHQYDRVLFMKMEGYKIGANDCVSYVDLVAEFLNLNTPDWDPTVFPDSYMEYLQKNNETITLVNHPLCYVTPTQQPPCLNIIKESVVQDQQHNAVSNTQTGLEEVLIGNQIWANVNLNTTTFRNGDQIQEAKTSEEWELANQERRPVWCHYDNDPLNGAKYGKIYNWYAVIDPRGLAPNGWHIPSKDAWNDLFDYLGSQAGYNLKSKIGWNKNGNGDNSSNFGALPGGAASYGSMYGRAFINIGNCVSYWTSTPISTESVCVIPLCDEQKGAGVFPSPNTSGMYVRCLKGETNVKKAK